MGDKKKTELVSNVNEKLSKEIAVRRKIQNELELANRKLAEASLIDALTGIPNRRKLEEFLNYEWKRAVREKTSISLIMIDIDFYKAFNDNYGHVAGDNCLINVAKALDSCHRRSTDFVARYGGEEFLFIALNTDKEGTRILAEKIREEIEALNILHEYSPVSRYVTVSVGITNIIPTEEDSLTESINNADKALYKAKQDGRNLVRSI